jgi:hypothetical protein
MRPFHRQDEKGYEAKGGRHQCCHIYPACDFGSLDESYHCQQVDCMLILQTYLLNKSSQWQDKVDSMKCRQGQYA